LEFPGWEIFGALKIKKEGGGVVQDQERRWAWRHLPRVCVEQLGLVRLGLNR
jgi:hypothetical protein